MKKFIVGIVALLMGMTAAHAALEVTLDGLAADNVTSATMVFSNLVSVATYDPGGLGIASVATESTVSGASGSFTVTWTATDISSPEDASAWSFGPACDMYSFGNGLGVISAGQTGGARMYTDGEAFMLTFNTNNLVLDAGKMLVFSLHSKVGESYKVFQRTGTTNGVVVSEATASTIDSFSPIATVDGLLEFAITDPGWDNNSGALLFLDFKVDVIDVPTGALPPAGSSVMPRDAGAFLTWLPDATGLLDFYTVYRTAISDDIGTYAAITNLVETEYLDTGLINDTTYYYALTATGLNGVESGYSEQLSVTPAALSTNTVLLMRYDASQTNSVGVYSNGLVSAWTNLVTAGTYDAMEAESGILYPSTQLSNTDLPGLDFTTNTTQLELMDATESDLLLDTTTGNSGFVVMMALRPEGIGTQQDIIGNTSTISTGFGLRWTGAGFATWLGGSVNLASTAMTGDTVVISFRYDVADSEFTSWESASENSVSATRLPADYSLAAGLTLGRTTNTGRNFNGEIFEVKIWGSTLDDATLIAEREALVEKWVGDTTGYGTWAGQWDGVDLGATTNDYDNDGILNINEYGLDGNPTNNTVEPAVLPILVNSGSGLEYLHVQRNNDPTLMYNVQTTTNLVSGSWTDIGVTAVSTNIGAGFFDTVTNTVDTVVDERFIRLIIEN